MTKLTSREYWDDHYAAPDHEREPSGIVHRLRRRVAHWDHGYDDFFLWHVLYKRYLPKGPGVRAIEIGSAPGTHMVRMAKAFGIDPWGIEYTPKGAELNRRVFAAAGIDSEQVIEADFFAESVRSRLAASFDVVISRGFIEHFDDPRSVVDRHVALLRSQGTLVVSIPNVSGLNRVIQRALDDRVVALHNLSIMTLEAFRALFAREDLQEVYCGYYGTFSLGLFNANTRPQRRPIVLAAHLLQRPLDVLERLVFGRRSVNHRATSPYLMYIGRVRR
jgi:SAM-dependent methyltransferase